MLVEINIPKFVTTKFLTFKGSSEVKSNILLKRPSITSFFNPWVEYLLLEI